MSALSQNELFNVLRSELGCTVDEAKQLVSWVEADDPVIVDNMLEGDTYARTDLVASANRYYAAFRAGYQDGIEQRGGVVNRDRPLGVSSKELVGDFCSLASEQEQLRGRVLERSYVRIAKDLEIVARWRESFGNRDLDEVEVNNILSSPLTAHLPLPLIWDHGLDPFDNSWVYSISTEGDIIHLINQSSFAREPLSIELGDRTGSMVWIDQEGREWENSFHKGSALESLDALASELAAGFGWRYKDSIQFLLTGDIPKLPFVRVRLSDAGTTNAQHIGFHRVQVRVESESWVSVNTINRVYLYVRSELKKAARVQRTKPLSESTLRVLEYVEEQKMVDEKRNLRSVARQYNSLLDAEDRFADPKHIEQAYRRGLMSILEPGHRIPEHAFLGAGVSEWINIYVALVLATTSILCTCSLAPNAIRLLDPGQTSVLHQ